VKQAVWPPGSADTVCPRPPVTLTLDRLTLKLVCESHLRPLSRRIPPPPQPAGTLPRRRRRKKFSAPPRQPKFTEAAAAAFFCGAPRRK